MNGNECELLRHCIDTDEYSTVKISQRYILIHRTIIRNQTDFKYPSNVIRKIFSSNYLSLSDAQLTSHIDSSKYDFIVFADQSIVYTPKSLPFYVDDDLKLLERIGMTKDDIDRFVQTLDAQEDFPLKNFDKILQKILDYLDIQTRLKCRQVCKQWRELIDKSSRWNIVKLSSNCKCIERALEYFQYVDIRELDLSEVICENFQLNTSFYLYSLRSLSISTSHPFELITSLFQIAPFLHLIKLIEPSSSTTEHLYKYVHFVLNQCQNKLKCLHRLHIRLRSQSDQIFLQSSLNTSIPVSYEILSSDRTCIFFQ